MLSKRLTFLNQRVVRDLRFYNLNDMVDKNAIKCTLNGAKVNKKYP